MLMVLITIFTFVTLSNTRKIDPVIEPYVDKFVTIADSYNIKMDKKDYDITFSRVLPTRTLGACYRDNRVIVINRTSWKYMTSTERELVVFHELGHCALDLDHDAEDPTSVMYAYAIDESIYKRYYSNLINKLFDCKNNCPYHEFYNLE